MHAIMHIQKWIQAQWNGPSEAKPNPENCRSVHMCVHCIALHCAQLLRTILHRTDLIIFPLALQTITTAPMMSIWGKGELAGRDVLGRYHQHAAEHKHSRDVIILTHFRDDLSTVGWDLLCSTHVPNLKSLRLGLPATRISKATQNVNTVVVWGS